MRKLVIFDLDGTTVFTMDDIAGSLNHALQENGYEPMSMEEVMKLVGYSAGHLCEYALPEAERKDKAPVILKDYMDHYKDHCCDRAFAYPDAMRTMVDLRRLGMELAVVSNKPNRDTQKVISTLYPEGLFSFVLGAMKSVTKKPAADPLLFVMEYLGYEKEETVYIGDSEVDIRFAENAGIECISCAWGYRSTSELEEAGAKKIIYEFSELLDIL